MISFLILAIGPSLLWVWLFYSSNRYRRASIKIVVLLFFGGILCGLLALTLNHMIEKYTVFWPEAKEMIQIFQFMEPIEFHKYGFWFMVGFNEEFTKLVVLLLVVYPSREIIERFDGILYATIVALGFASIENLFYLDQYGSSVLISRAIVTIPAHAFMSVPMGYFLALSRFYHFKSNETGFDISKPYFLIMSGWFISSFFHGLYDFWLSIGLELMAYGQIILMGLLTLVLARHSFNHSALSPKRFISS